MPKPDPKPPRLRLRIYFEADFMLGPGKAELLERIRDTGSISAAGRQMDMSYKRAWMLVEEMNKAFTLPVVSSARGGSGGGGAHLTEAGEEVLRRYRAAEAALRAATVEDVSALQAMLRSSAVSDVSDGK